jgi:hypothetical protein
MFTNNSSEDKMALIREETRDLSKSMNHVYNSIVFSCQKRCLTDFKSNIASKEEQTCLLRCANEFMFFDNFIYETDSAQQIASTQGKPKKASFYISRRIEDLTN